ncbi:MAG TPA: hypothetical protein VIH26_04310 [Anaerolineales bacterium]
MGALPYELQPHLLGGGQVAAVDGRSFRLELPALPRGYADAQVDDCKGRRRSQFAWAPPAILTLRARASHPSPPGTLGFGFWNDPFGVSLGGAGGLQKLPAAPQAVWFFYGSPPNDFSFVRGGRGDGWKAASLRSLALPAALLVPGAALAFLAGNVPVLRKWVVRAVQAAIPAAEAELSVPLTEWHTYSLHWETARVSCEMDGVVVLDAPVAPRGRLGFVAWIDNQYAVLSERTGIRFGVVPTTAPAWLEIADLEIRSPPVP